MSDSRDIESKRREQGEHFLKPRPRSTPCVGICSTSHGDFVCRGCKRFFNEVRDWLSFEPEQRELVLQRLARLKRESVHATVQISDLKLLYSRTKAFVPDGDEDSALRIYEALAHCKGDYAGWGLKQPESDELKGDPVEVLRAIEDDYYERSRGTFEQIYSRPSR